MMRYIAFALGGGMPGGNIFPAAARTLLAVLCIF
jgi:hypothetical protein